VSSGASTRQQARGSTAIAPKRIGCDKAGVRCHDQCLKLLIAALLPAVGGCTAQVYHPTKSPAQMQADVALCTHQANKEVWYDPIAALYRAYDCLEDKGYRRSNKDFASQVERAFGESRKEQDGAKPCRVPCLPAGARPQ
jgi:hypothetical protein